MNPRAAMTVVGELTKAHPVQARQLGGGSTGRVYEVELADGGRMVAKTRTDHAPRAVDAEAASLAWLAETDTVAVPRVHAHNDRWLVLEYVEPGAPTPAAAEVLGRDLAALHAAGAPAFGAAPPGGPVQAWIGLAPMRNVAAQTGIGAWPEFYARYRIEPYLRRAVDAGTLTPGEGREISLVCDVIADIAGPAEPPARLHGDLWGGNVHWAATGHRSAWLIDPAAHGGHRETDLASLRLFGCPHLDRVLAAYHEAAPLADGWQDRVPLHQLFLLLVHVDLFGRGYVSRTLSAARHAAALA